MDRGSVFWAVVAIGVMLAVVLGLALALLPPHGGEDDRTAF